MKIPRRRALMYPHLKNKKILVLDSPRFCSYADFVAKADVGTVSFDAHHFLINPEMYSLIHFTGGEDITPSFYGETSPKGMCGFNQSRDEFEGKIFAVAKAKRIPMFGICRGSQFLNVMTGGKMVHHMSGHGGVRHDIILNTECIVPNRVAVNSTHHQMMIPSTFTRVLAWAAERLSNVYYGDRDEKMIWSGPEIESIYVPLHRVLGVQWHPETMADDSPGYQFSLRMLKDFVELEVYEFTAKYNPTDKDLFFKLKKS
jgi:gamma-glutamyl-gamma-aminobutyrate hydrolase PuuD